MGWQQYNPEVIWEEINVTRSQQVRKRIWDEEDQMFREVRFVRVFISNRTDRERVVQEYQRDHGEPQYQGTWWHDDHSIWLHESLATWWFLKNGQ